MRHGPGRGKAKSTEANWVQKEAGGLVHQHSPVMCYKTTFPFLFIFFFFLWNFSLEKIVFIEFVISLLDVNFLLIMMWNVTCLCKKLQIWDMGFCHCWISLRNIVKDLQKTQVEYLNRKGWCGFSRKIWSWLRNVWKFWNLCNYEVFDCVLTGLHNIYLALYENFITNVIYDICYVLQL